MAHPAASPAPAPMPGPSRGRFLLLGLAIWGFVVLGFASQTYALYAVKRESLPFGTAVVWAFNDWAGWLLLAPIVLWLARRFPVERPRIGARLALHLAFGTIVAGAHGPLFYLMEKLSGQLDPGDQAQLLMIYTAKNMVLGLLVYAALVAVSHGLTYYRRYRERELRTTQLSAQLSRAELDVLKMQLQPHFLFNTLHAISALVHSDAEAADRIITRLGDLLRLSLQSNGSQEVPLRQELEFVEKYMDIQLTRFRDRLSIRVDAPAETLDAQVPSLILQPLIENSIRHGVERQERRAAIVVSARREGNRLILQVTDDGPGFPETVLTPLPGRGLGLGNTRARIAALYGTDGRLACEKATGGGATVTIDIPFRRASHGDTVA